MSQALRLGSYELKTQLAEGGFCEIWLAIQHGPMGFKRWCALKRLKASRRGEEASERALMAEARILSMLHHPHLISMIDFVHEPAHAQSYYTMPYVSGKTLGAVINKGFGTRDFVLADALYVGECLLDALSIVHALRDENTYPMHIVHCDISPENVLVSFEGQVYLIDFGIALSKLIARQTVSRTIVGKAQYLSPEQARADKPIDRRTDIYAAGLVLYYMFTGHEAYSSDPTRALQQARNPALPSLEAVGSIPTELANLVRAMLHPDPARRSEDAGAIAKHLHSLRQKYFPRHDPWKFRKHIGRLLAHDHQSERDFLASLQIGTQVITKDAELLTAQPIIQPSDDLLHAESTVPIMSPLTFDKSQPPQRQNGED